MSSLRVRPQSPGGDGKLVEWMQFVRRCDHEGRQATRQPVPFAGGNSTVTIDNIGRQIDRYLNEQIVWGGGNDLFDNDSAAKVNATSGRVVARVNPPRRCGRAAHPGGKRSASRWRPIVCR